MSKPVVGDPKIDREANERVESFNAFFSDRKTFRGLDRKTLRRLSFVCRNVLNYSELYGSFRVDQAFGGVKGNK